MGWDRWDDTRIDQQADTRAGVERLHNDFLPSEVPDLCCLHRGLPGTGSTMLWG